MGNTDKIADKIVGENIRMVRESLKMSQAKLCKAVGLSIKALSQIENGHTQVRSSNLIAIAKALDVPVRRLHAGSEDPGAVDGGWNEVTPEMMDKLARAAAHAYESPLKAEIEALKAENAKLQEKLSQYENLISAWDSSVQFPLARQAALFFLTGKLPDNLPHQRDVQAWKDALKEGVLKLVKISRTGSESE